MSSSWNGPEVNQQGRPVVLVTGGAGYVGAHTCLRLSEAGFAPVVFDNLSNGHEAFVQWGPLVKGDVRDAVQLDAMFATHRPVAVLHFAALSLVGFALFPWLLDCPPNSVAAQAAGWDSAATSLPGWDLGGLRVPCAAANSWPTSFVHLPKAACCRSLR